MTSTPPGQKNVFHLQRSENRDLLQEYYLQGIFVCKGDTALKKMSACVTMVEANWKIQMEEKTYVYYR